MKMRSLVSNLLFSFLIFGSLVAANSEKGCKRIKCTLEKISGGKAHFSGPMVPVKKPRAKGLGKPIVFSTNWSGYAAENNFSSPDKHSVTSVEGSWIVPSISPAQSGSYCYIWAGIDGYDNDTVEQIGTAHNWFAGSLQQFAWFEMFPAGAFFIGGFPVNTGDQIKVSVKYAGNHTFILKIYNITQQVFFQVPTSLTKSKAAKRQSAEWIVEAPLQPLSNFSPIQFGSCTAIIKGQKEVTGWFPHTPIVMVDSNFIPQSIPSPIPTILSSRKGAFFVTRQPETPA